MPCLVLPNNITFLLFIWKRWGASFLFNESRQYPEKISSSVFLAYWRRWLNGVVLRMRPCKPKSRVMAGMARERPLPVFSKAISAYKLAYFCSLSPIMVTSLYEWNILERDEKQYTCKLKFCCSPVLKSWNRGPESYSSVHAKNVRFTATMFCRKVWFNFLQMFTL